jgi:hypothetical protein
VCVEQQFLTPGEGGVMLTTIWHRLPLCATMCHYVPLCAYKVTQSAAMPQVLGVYRPLV